uniref:Putative allatostatin n=1 Tax=Corethrella appendiculata TaxID=1370023 RepID=U5ERK0_9DIPT
MRVYAVTLILLGYLALALCMPQKTQQSLSSFIGDFGDEPQQQQQQQRLAARSPKYNFGLGKRRYVLDESGPGAKRLPHYNFGLGKRGKADPDYEVDAFNPNNWPAWNDNFELTRKNDLGLDYDFKREPITTVTIPYDGPLGKRRAYDFGLGKRFNLNDEFDKRLPNRYNFGLGR